MKKKILYLVLLLVFITGVTGCGKNKLNEIANKINNCKIVSDYKKYNYEIKATTSKNTLTITSKIADKESKVEFKLNGDILSNENISSADYIALFLVLDGVGQTYGYKDGELMENINAFSEEFMNYTLNNEGIEIVADEDNDKFSLKINISKKVPLIDMSKFYLKADDFDMISKFVNEKTTGNQSGNSGNLAYDVFVGEDESTITIGQNGKLADSAYKSIVSAIEVMYGEEVANHFQEIYPSFVDGTKTVEAFTIEKGYKPEDQDNSIFKDTEVVLVTIDNSKIK